MILDLIEKNKNITQREMSITIGSAVSMVNNFLDEYEQKGYIKRKYLSTKTVEYFVTHKGIERRKILNIGYLHSAQKIYNYAKSNIEKFLEQLTKKGFSNILLYGAGEVAEILLHSLSTNTDLDLKVIAIVDDDPNKLHTILVSSIIISIDEICCYNHDGILISSFTNRKEIKDKLLLINYSQDKIFRIFWLGEN